MGTSLHRLFILIAFVTGLGSASRAQAPCGSSLTGGLVTRLPFDEQAGSVAYNAIGPQYNAGITAGSTWSPTAGIQGSGAVNVPDGGHVAVELPVNWQPTAYTISWWIRPTERFDYGPAVWDRWGTFAFHSTASGEIYVGTDIPTRIHLTGDIFPLNVWQQYIFTFDQGVGRLYKDGQLLEERLGMTMPGVWGSHVFLAGGGLYDETRIYNRALTSAEARYLYDYTCPFACLVSVSVTPPSGTIAANTPTALRATSNVAGHSLAFDGVDDIVAVNPVAGSPLATTTGTFTVEAWVWPTATHEIDPEGDLNTFQGLYGGIAGQRYLIFPASGGLSSTEAGMGVSVGTNGISVYEHASDYMPASLVWQGALANRWTHLTVVYTNGRPSLYVDGALVHTGVASPRTDVRPSVYIGGGQYGHYEGRLDELRIWNRARNAAEIASDYNRTVASTSSGLVGYWRFDENSGVGVADAALTHHVGILSNGASRLLSGPAAPIASDDIRWSPTAGLSTSTGPQVTATPSATTTYVVTAAGPDGCGTAQATATLTVTSTLPNNPSEDLNRNWTIARTFDGNGNVIAESKQFTDGLGRATQAQARNVANGHVFATQTIYSSGGQPVLQTLAAPINNQSFRYQEHFVTATTTPLGGGTPTTLDYGPDNFEGAKASSPDPLDEATPGTLGYYYSQQNQLEPLTPAAHNPYSLVEQYEGPWGGIKRAAAPGEHFRMGSGREGRSREFPLRKEFDHYAGLRPQFVPGSPLNTLQYQGSKTVTVDADGRENIVVTNKDGQTLVTCLSGAQYPTVDVFGFISTDPANTYDANAPAFQDVHIPAAGPASVTFTVGDWVRIKNLQTGDSTDYEITPRGPSPGIQVTLQPGFYRFISLGGTQYFYYKAHYGNFSYTYYDDAGRVVATVAPNGLAQGNVVKNPSFDLDPSGAQPAQFWQTDGNANAVHTEAYGGAHSGTLHGTHYDGPGTYYAFTHQLISNLPNGRYTLRAWVKGSGGQDKALLIARNYGGPLMSATIPFTPNGPTGAWTQLEILGIEVTNGQCDVGFESNTIGARQFIYFDDVELMRETDATAPAFVTRNSYDTLGKLLSTESTDEGRTEYVYARDGRIRFSQSALQRPAGRYSYSNYDELGRVVESGEYVPGQTAGHVFENHLTTNATGNSVLQPSILEDRTRSGGLDPVRCTQRSQIWYDLPFQDAQLNGRTQEFTLGAVAKTSNDQVTTWYSYDELGRVAWVVQNITGVGVKTLDYTYDFSGNVLEVAYQTGQPDAFRHHYEYDAAQRLYQVYTSPDGVARTLQAKYFYYLHGPLKRVELANGLQGMDYTYTLQGWLKGINHVNGRLDPGGDSPAGNGRPKDLFALTLNYFSGDYQSRAQAAVNLASPSTLVNPFRYDGTIRTASWRTAGSPVHRQSSYEYDAKGQLTQSNFGALTIAGPLASSTYVASPSQAYQEGGLSYDQNGNIQSLRRTNQGGAVTDNFTYKYAANTNKLTEVHGGGATGPTVLDYDYDALGQMTRQRDEQGQRYLTYNVSGKTTGVYLDAAHQQPVVEFAYDDRGFRVSKKSYGAGSSAGQVRTTYYVRDVAGNVLSVYEQGPQTGNAVQRSEVPLYGSARVGTLTRLDDGSEDYRYELNDNLGNARVVFHKPTTETKTETMELSGVSSQAAFQNNNLYRAAFSGAPSGGYVAQFSDSQAPGTELKRTLTVEKGDTITFSAQGLLQDLGAANSSARMQPYLLLGTAANSDEVPVRGIDGRLMATRTTPGKWLGRVAAGLSFAIGQRKKDKGAAQFRTTTSLQGWIKYRVLNDQGVEVGTYTNYLVGNGSWESLRVGVRAQQSGTVEVIAGSTGQGSAVYFDNLTVEQTGGMIVQEQHQYAYGSPLVGLNYAVGNKRYRYGYQGQYAETDAETGFESFELRLYNDRIGRWTSYDPENQFYSPYVGMGNNPVSRVDPNGGFSDPVQLAEVVVTGASQGSKFLSTIASKLILPSAMALPRVLAPRSRIGNWIPDNALSTPQFRKEIATAKANELYRWNRKYNPDYLPGGTNYPGDGIEPSFLLESLIIPVLAEARVANLSTNIYRAVSQAELEDIAQVGLRNQSNYETGKLFAPTVTEAATYGRNNWLFSRGIYKVPHTVMRVKVPNSVLRNATFFEADGMNAISISADQLKLLKAVPLKFSPVLKPHIP